MPPSLNALMPFILLWVVSNALFLMLVIRNAKINRQTKIFWCIIILAFWYNGASLYVLFGLGKAVVDYTLEKKATLATS
jgi:hypothetical protein